MMKSEEPKLHQDVTNPTPTQKPKAAFIW